MNNNNGFTLIELLAAMVVYSLLAVFAAMIIRFASRTLAGGEVKSEVLSQAHTALNFSAGLIREANGYKYAFWSPSRPETLRYLDLYTPRPVHEHIFVLDYRHSQRRLNFGGFGASLGVNELASDIEDIKVFVDEDKRMLYMTVTAQADGEIVTLGTAVSLVGKDRR